jgi:purine-binding chemotaxis protein CheW
MTSSYLLFQLSERLFGVKLGGAIEILPWRPCRPVPLSYSYVEGLLDYRGTIYPVYNLVQRLGIGTPGPIGFTADHRIPAAKGKSIILLEERFKPFGIVADSVVKMANLEEQAAAREKVQGIDPKHVKGFVYHEDHEAVILDFERLFYAG